MSDRSIRIRAAKGFEDLARWRLRDLRQRAGATGRASQQALADEMNTLPFGFSWSRETVNQIEIGNRRISPLELLGLAVVFGVPIAVFFLPVAEEGKPPEVLDLPDGHALDSSAVLELLLGRTDVGQGVGIGRGGADDWQLADQIAGRPRPLARQLWAGAAVQGNLIAAQYPKILAHLPLGELEPDDVEFTHDSRGLLIVVRSSDGAQFSFVELENGETGVVRVTFEGNEEVVDFLRDGEVVELSTRRQRIGVTVPS